MGAGSHQPPKAVQTGPFASDRLDSWKEIARYLNRDVRTVQRWEQTGGLPVYRHKRGRLKGSPVYAYRSEIEGWLRQSPPPPIESEQKLSAAVRTGWSPRRVAWVVLPVLVLAATGVMFWRLVRSTQSRPAMREVQLTTNPGLSHYPSFSPDGESVVFSWNGENEGNFDLYTLNIKGGNPVKLTTDPALDGWPAWSPDGETIAYGRYFFPSQKLEIRAVSARGGKDYKIGDFFLPVQSGTELEYFPGACWTPDSRFLIRPDSSGGPSAPTRLVLTDIKTHEDRPLMPPMPDSTGDRCPAITRDGSRLAFLRATQGRTRNVYYVLLGPNYLPRGEPVQLTNEPSPGAMNPMWTGDGQEVLYLAVRDGARALWRVRYDDPLHPRQVESAGPIGSAYTISRDGRNLVFSDYTADINIWGLDLVGGKDIASTMSSSARDVAPEFAPDGKKVAVISDRSGQPQIYIYPSEGGSPNPLPVILGGQSGTPRWSPDSEQIAFQCVNEGNDDVCTIPAEGVKARRVTYYRARDVFPSWSRDGKWIYFASNRSGSFEVWKAPADGTDADAIQLTKGGGLHPVEAGNGNVYFARETSPPTLWQIPSGGGEEKRVGNFEILGWSAQDFAVGSEGIYYTSTTDSEHWFEVWLYKFATGKSERIRRINKRHSGGLTVSPDGRRLLFGAYNLLAGNLHLVENFR